MLPQTSYIFDGLWRCLCPSIDAVLLAKAASGSFRRPSRPPAVRRFHTSRSTHGHHLPQKVALPPTTVDDLIKLGGNDPNHRTLHDAPTETIYEALTELRHRQSQQNKIKLLVRHLVEVRGEQPNVSLYDALVTTSWDTGGSAVILDAVMKDMKKSGIAPTVGFYHTALRLLAVHPNYVQRNDILFDMEVNDEPLNAEGRCSVALGLLRDGQEEMAMDYLDDMMSNAVEFPSWIFDIFVFVLGRRGFVDEAVQLMLRRPMPAEDGNVDESSHLWYFLLDESSRSLYYPGTKLIWDRMVAAGRLNPPDGMVTAVLDTAARRGDAELATQAVQYLSRRNIKLGHRHYEALIECYVQDGDLANAFRVLCIMHGTGTSTGEWNTRQIAQRLGESAELAENSVAVLSELSGSHDIPLAALDVVLEGLCFHKKLKEAAELFQNPGKLRIPAASLDTSTQATFGLLLKSVESDEDARLVLSVMRQLRNPLPLRLNDETIRCFALLDDLDTCFEYIESRGGVEDLQWLPVRNLLLLIKKCLEMKDSRVWVLFGAMPKGDLDGENREKLQDIEAMLAVLREPGAVGHASDDIWATANDLRPVNDEKKEEATCI